MREPSTSITQLVKNVAEEVFDKKMRERADIETDDRLWLRNTVEQIGNNFCGKIESSLEKAGRKWSDEETEMFKQEIRTAIAQIAKNHSRSVGAIKARIEQFEEELLY